MTCLSNPLSVSLAAFVLLAACTAPSAEEGGQETGDTTGDGDGDAPDCTDPGSELLPEAKPALVPVPNGIDFTCASGWGSDAPERDADWTGQIGMMDGNFVFVPVRVAAHPDGGVVVATTGVFARYAADGEQLWSTDSGASLQSQSWLVVEQSGTIVLANYDWNQDDTTLRRYDADGELIGDVAVQWNSPYANIWGLESFGADLLIGASDEDENGSYESTLIHLDPSDTELLRKSTSQSGGQLLAVNDAGTVMFGLLPGFLVSLDDGGVLGTWAPSSGNANEATGFGDDFVTVGNSAGDLSIGRYSNLGSERWLQTYDHAALGDSGRALAAAPDVGPDGTIVAVGSSNLLNNANSYWYSSQPLIIAADADGNALWRDRIAVHGEANAVAIGTSDEVWVGGIAETDVAVNEEPDLILWLRRYD